MSQASTKIVIVTPSYNTAETLDTLLSNVFAQAGNFHVHHHVQDGGSTDGTVDILKRWSSIASHGVVPKTSGKYSFSYQSQPDAGMYDAIARGLARFTGMPGNTWFTWLNADDTFETGALATLAHIDHDLGDSVRWLGGDMLVMDGHVQLAASARPTASQILREGLCDGFHYDFFQQEGTFFRASSWRRIDATKFSTFKLAGDWFLWWQLAQFEELHQANRALAAFHMRPGQKSENKEQYYAEIEAYLPYRMRNSAFERIDKFRWNRPAVKRRWDKRAFVCEREEVPRDPAVERRRAVSRQGYQPPAPAVLEPAEGGSAFSKSDLKVFDYGRDWQFPAITEQHALKKITEVSAGSKGLTYIGFPWATLIDLRNNFKAAEKLTNAAFDLKAQIQDGARVVTVCQHIHLRRVSSLMKSIGITDVFWSHAERGVESVDGLTIHPFPLFPVQQLVRNTASAHDRKYLFSFVGAKPSNWYLSDVRKHILVELPGAPDGKVIGREAWHYEQVVYQLQIQGGGRDASSSSVTDAYQNKDSDDFQETLKSSKFALCPSGSGPNSIRLWEAIGAGCIPVVLAESWRPPGDARIWEEAAVFCQENVEAVRALPARLRALADQPEKLAEMRNACAQLWLLYGPEAFVSDIQALSLASANQISAQCEPRAVKPLRVFIYGRHQTRVVLNYKAYAPHFEGDIELVDEPRRADMLIVGFDTDLVQNSEEILRFVDETPSMRLVVLSEEPLWDSIWSKQYKSKCSRLIIGGRELPVSVLNHVTTKIFDFDRIPYYVTTRDVYAQRYASLLNRFSDETPSSLRERWISAPQQYASVAERREGAQYSVRDPGIDLVGLCSYRSELASALQARGGLCLGKGWHADAPRQSLPDWHLDKLARLDRQVFRLSALENTHLNNYITEKMFDAFSVGAYPVYSAGKHHRVREFVASEAFLNVFGMAPSAAAEAVAAFEPSLSNAEAWLESKSKMVSLFVSADTLIAERARVAMEVKKELRAILEDSADVGGGG